MEWMDYLELLRSYGFANGCCGAGSGKTILDTPTPFLEAIMKVNLSSHFVLIKEFLPGMLEAKKGHVVTIASMASFTAVPGLVDYCVTKVGALALTEGMFVSPTCIFIKCYISRHTTLLFPNLLIYILSDYH